MWYERNVMYSADLQMRHQKLFTLARHFSVLLGSSSVPVLESSVMSGPEKIRSRGSWSHIVSKATDA